LFCDVAELKHVKFQVVFWVANVTQNAMIFQEKSTELSTSELDFNIVFFIFWGLHNTGAICFVIEIELIVRVSKFVFFFDRLLAENPGVS